MLDCPGADDTAIRTFSIHCDDKAPTRHPSNIYRVQELTLSHEVSMTAFVSADMFLALYYTLWLNWHVHVYERRSNTRLN